LPLLDGGPNAPVEVVAHRAEPFCAVDGVGNVAPVTDDRRRRAAGRVDRLEVRADDDPVPVGQRIRGEGSSL
jgi:hypothetical protein